MSHTVILFENLKGAKLIVDGKGHKKYIPSNSTRKKLEKLKSKTTTSLEERIQMRNIRKQNYSKLEESFLKLFRDIFKYKKCRNHFLRVFQPPINGVFFNPNNNPKRKSNGKSKEKSEGNRKRDQNNFRSSVSTTCSRAETTKKGR